MKRIIMDLDNTICITKNSDYKNSKLIPGIVERLREYREEGFQIVISTSRNVRTYNGNLGKINAHTLPIIIQWLDSNSVPYDEIYVGKPWCGDEGFYVDDRSIRPNEFLSLSYEELKKVVGIHQ